MSVRSADYSVIGASGLNALGGILHEELLVELQGRRGRRIFREMRDNDPIISSIMFAIEMVMRQVDWSVAPYSTDAVDQANAQFLDECRDDMSISWVEFVTEALSMLTYGWAYFEIVYKQRGGDSSDPTKHSKFDDGRVGWRKFAIRDQESLIRWAFDDEGGLQAMVQAAAPNFAPVTIPIDKALLFRTTTRKASPEGRSVIRGAYVPWYLSKEIQTVEAIGITRDVAGLPVVTAPSSYMKAAAPPDQQAMIASLLDLVTKLKRDEMEGVVFPSDRDEHGQPLFELKLLNSGGSRQFDINATLGRYDQRKAMTCLADFILLGHEAVGSKALSSNKTDLFMMAVGAWLDTIESVINDYAVTRLFALNGLDTERLPRVVHGKIERTDLAQVGAYVQALSAAGMPLFPNPDLERELLTIGGLPAAQEDAG